MSTINYHWYLSKHMIPFTDQLVNNRDSLMNISMTITEDYEKSSTIHFKSVKIEHLHILDGVLHGFWISSPEGLTLDFDLTHYNLIRFNPKTDRIRKASTITEIIDFNIQVIAQ